MPAWRGHEFRRLNYIVFNLERRDDLHRAGTNRLIQISDGFRSRIRSWYWRRHVRNRSFAAPGAVRLGLTGYSSKILGGRASDPAQPLN
jgi:hypothetical protein